MYNLNVVAPLILALKEVEDITGVNDFQSMSFSTRRTIQDMVYLLQHYSIDLGFDYKWSFYPYSTDLSDVLEDYSIDKSFYDEGIKNYSLTDKTKKHITLLKEWLEVTKFGDIEMSDWMLVLCSLHYFKYKKYIRNKNMETVLSLFQECTNIPLNDNIEYAYELIRLKGERFEL